jgi:glycosyltransferase involved in cell wall biosynthesis
LQGHGHEVLDFSRYSDEIRGQGGWGVLKGALATPFNPFVVSAVRRAVKHFDPDVVHVHNTFPLISPAVFHATGPRATRILTLHNYRLFCAAAIPLRQGKPCTLCLAERSIWPALRYGCYRGSRLATLPLAASIGLHRSLGTWHRHVDGFIALTDFQRDRMVEAGLPSLKVFLKPHFYDKPPLPLPWSQRKGDVVFVGRLSEEKGLRFLLDAWIAWGRGAPRLELIGQGPEREQWETRVRETGMESRVVFTGQLPFEQVQDRVAHARLLILPSICFEGFPMVIREAFALGVPVAASRLGSMQNLIESGYNGALFEPSDTGSLLRAVRELWGSPRQLAAMGQQARMTFENRYTAHSNYEQLMAIYRVAGEFRRPTS